MTITHRPTRGDGLSDVFDEATAAASSCQGKHPFRDRHEAERVIKRRKQSAKRRHAGHQARAYRATLHCYRCRHCGHWHISGSRK